MDQGSASGTGPQGSRSPNFLGPGLGLILKSGTETGIQIQNMRDRGLEPGPERKIRKSGIRDRDSKLKNPGSGIGTGTQSCGTRDSGTQLWGTVPGLNNFGTRSRELKLPTRGY